MVMNIPLRSAKNISGKKFSTNTYWKRIGYHY